MSAGRSFRLLPTASSTLAALSQCATSARTGAAGSSSARTGSVSDQDRLPQSERRGCARVVDSTNEAPARNLSDEQWGPAKGVRPSAIAFTRGCRVNLGPAAAVR